MTTTETLFYSLLDTQTDNLVKQLLCFKILFTARTIQWPVDLNYFVFCRCPHCTGTYRDIHSRNKRGIFDFISVSCHVPRLSCFCSSCTFVWSLANDINVNQREESCLKSWLVSETGCHRSFGCSNRIPHFPCWSPQTIRFLCHWF
jgi:hypothetical protein